MTELDDSRVRTAQSDLLTAPVGPDLDSAPGPLPTWRDRTLAHIQEPFFRNAYALIINTGLTGVLGIAFWAIAARHYDDPDVGRGSALISAMTLLSGVVGINMSGTLSRFVPTSGQRTRRLVAAAYALSSAAVVALAGLFLLLLDSWGPSYELLRDPTTAFWFVLAIIAAGIFTVQDGVLVGLRNAVWVPVENVVFGVAKIVLVIVLAVGSPKDGVFLSWVVPMALILLPINALIFGRLIPRHSKILAPRLPPPREIGRFFLGDYLGALFMFGAACLIPVLVAPFVQAHTFAYFYVAWIAGGMLNLVSTNLASSLTVEGALEAGGVVSNCRAALRRAMGLLGVAAVAVGLFAPYGLELLGRGYLDAAPMLQALALAAIPRAVIEIWVGALRARSRVREVARVQIASGGAAIGSVLVWLHYDGLAAATGLDLITGVGVAVLVSQLAVALAVLPGLRRFLGRQVTADRSGGGTAAAPATTAVATHMPAVARGTRLAPMVLCGTGAVGVVLVVVGVLSVQPTALIDAQLKGFGLVSVLPVSVFVGLALLVIGFVATLSLRRAYPFALGAQLVAIVCCLHGTGALSSTLPRFPITWIHIGFVEFIGRTGTVAPELDARFSWPAFFALVAFWLGGRDWHELVPVLGFVPVLSNLAYLLPMAVLLRNVRSSWRARWLAAWLFGVLNWVGQDYFSPQGYTYGLYLVFVACLVTWLRPVRADRRRGRQWTQRMTAARPLRALRRGVALVSPRPTHIPGELPPTPAGPGLRTAVLVLVLGLFLVATASHQLTPFLMVAACSGLVVVRRCAPIGLPLLLTVLLAGWISYLAVGYWGGHLDVLLGSVGDIGGNVSTSVVARTGGGDQRRVVVALRIAVAVTVFTVAALGALRRRRRGIDDRIVLVLLLAPFIAIGLQSYGGEIALRVYLFALPAAAVLAAYAIFPDPDPGQVRARRAVPAALGALVLVGAFLVARYGNERYERVDAGSFAVVDQVYGQSGRTGPRQIVTLTDPPATEAPPFLPVGYRDLERVTWTSLVAPEDPSDINDLLDELRSLGPGAVFVTSTGTEGYLEVSSGYDSDWADRFRERLADEPQLRLLVANPDAAAYALRATSDTDGAPLKQMTVTGMRIGDTPWTPAGIVLLATLAVGLTTRQVTRLRRSTGSDPLVSVLTVTALVGFALVILERLVLLA